MKIYKSLIYVLLLLTTTSFADKMEDNSSNNTENYEYSPLSNKCQVYDPYEKLNRKIYFFNGVLDTFLLRPVARWYDKATNDFVKQRVRNFTSNVEEPLSSVNYALQGKFGKSFKSFWKFVINSTFGFAGFFDPAAKAGIDLEKQNLGNTLAHYGVGSGPYIVLPIFGGTSARDAGNPLIFSFILNPLNYVTHKDFRYITSGVDVIDSRHRVMPFTDFVSRTSADSYVSIRNAIISQRESKMQYPDNFVCPAVDSN